MAEDLKIGVVATLPVSKGLLLDRDYDAEAWAERHLRESIRAFVTHSLAIQIYHLRQKRKEQGS